MRDDTDMSCTVISLPQNTIAEMKRSSVHLMKLGPQLPGQIEAMLQQ